MMKMYSMKKMLSVILCIVLIAAMALTTTGCGSKAPAEAAKSGDEVTFTLLVVDKDGNETTMEVTTDKAMVGEALLEQGIIEGEEGDYGLYIHAVNGMALDWEKDGKYWAFYIDGEYAMTGVDLTEITPGATYELRAEA